MEWLDERVAEDGTEALVDELLNEMEVEQALARLRDEQGITQTELAQRMGVKQPLIARLEAGGIKNLTLKTLVRTAAALGARVRIQVERDSFSQHKAPSRKMTASSRRLARIGRKPRTVT